VIRITIEVPDNAVYEGEVDDAIASGEPATLEMPGWGSAATGKIVAVETVP
jgi:hypothetical protein